MIRIPTAQISAAALLLAAGLAPARAAQAIPLVAHRAIYELSLDPGKASSRVDSARGRIAYEMRGNACEGYSVNLRQVTELDTGEGSKTTSDLRSATWEDGSAKSFRFKNQNFVNRELKDEVDGTANRSDDGSLQVKLGKTKGGTALKFGAPVLLPTEQIVKILKAAEGGSHFIEAKVFDGSPDGKKAYQTLSIVGGGRSGDDPNVEQAARIPALNGIKRFPVTVSYFDAKDDGETTPAYTLGFELYQNGVSRALKLDYGSFTLKGELTSIEFFKPTPCEK